MQRRVMLRYSNFSSSDAQRCTRSILDAKAMSNASQPCRTQKAARSARLWMRKLKTGGGGQRPAQVAVEPISSSITRTEPISTASQKEARPHYEPDASDHAAILSLNREVGSDTDSLVVLVAEKASCTLIRSEISQTNSASLSTSIQDLFPGLPSNSGLIS